MHWTATVSPDLLTSQGKSKLSINFLLITVLSFHCKCSKCISSSVNKNKTYLGNKLKAGFVIKSDLVNSKETCSIFYEIKHMYLWTIIYNPQLMVNELI